MDYQTLNKLTFWFDLLVLNQLCKFGILAYEDEEVQNVEDDNENEKCFGLGNSL